MGGNSSNWIVLKFGGTSVSSLQNWQNIQSIVSKRLSDGYSVLLVHSALSGVSNLLQEIIDKAPAGGCSEQASEIKQKHDTLANELDLSAQKLLEEDFNELDELVSQMQGNAAINFRLQARLLSLGEMMSTKLGAAYLSKELERTSWRDARSLIKSIPQKNANERSLMLSAVSAADYEPRLYEEMSDAGQVVVTQGFIGSNDEGETVVLGRGGSDVSAAYFAAKMGAERLEIWTDVPGLFSANPHEVPSARLLNHLGYDEAQEISTNGAKILHPRSIMPARRHNIPIHVKCTLRPDLQGTIISSEASDEEALVKAISIREDVLLVSMDSLGMWQEVGFLSDAFKIFTQYGLSIDLVSTSQSNVTVSLDPGVNAHFQDVRDDFIYELSKHCNVEIIESVAAVSLLGRRIRTILHQLGPAFEVFQEHQVYLVSQAANDLNFTFVVKSDQADRLVRQLHEQVILQSGNQQSFGPTWPELMEDRDRQAIEDRRWWKGRKDELLEIAEHSAPIYVYNTETLRQSAKLIGGLESVDQALYAIKANDNPQVMEVFRNRGFGFECVSLAEVQKVMELFPDIEPTEILFTPNFAPRVEYEKGLELGINVTLDNIYPLQKWPEVFKGQEVFLRIDPGHGNGHHKHVKTGGIHSKFGIPRFEIAEISELIKDYDITVRGLHAHIGSGIKDPLSWKTTALILDEVAKELGGVEILDLGGGFGIRENENQAALDMLEVNKSLNDFKQSHPEYKLWVEPGRFLVATAGVLLTHITQLKGKGAVRYVGVDTGMNSFIRPALYGARHTIVNLSKLDLPNTQTVNVVGPICESGDKLGIDRLFPDSEEGDVVLVANTGAYGKVMSSNYNMRVPAGEVVIG